MTAARPEAGRPWRLPVGLAAGALSVALPLPALLPHAILDVLFAETGIVETGSVVVYVALAVAAALARPRRGGEASIALAGLLLAARELDLHRRFTTMNVEKCLTLCFFMAAKVPMGEKLVVGVVLLALLAYTGCALRRWSRPFLVAVRTRATPAVTAVVGLVVLLVSQVLDEGAHGLRHRGWRGLADYPWVGAEMLELIGPVLLLLAVVQRAAGRGESPPAPAPNP